jgi:hypothetical protein
MVRRFTQMSADFSGSGKRDTETELPRSNTDGSFSPKMKSAPIGVNLRISPSEAAAREKPWDFLSGSVLGSHPHV